MLTGAAKYDSAFSQRKWELVPGHSKLYYEVESNDMCDNAEIISPIVNKKKESTKFEKYNLNLPSISTSSYDYNQVLRITMPLVFPVDAYRSVYCVL